MRRTALGLTVLLLAGCRGDDGDRAAAPAAENAAPSTTTTAGRATRPPVDVIAGLVCDDAATRLSGDPEAPNGSWNCTRGGEQLRIDYYVDETDQPDGPAPVICGPRFGIAIDSPAIKSALLAELNQAEIPVSTCP